jgi:hypothetical protein
MAQPIQWDAIIKLMTIIVIVHVEVAHVTCGDFLIEGSSLHTPCHIGSQANNIITMTLAHRLVWLDFLATTQRAINVLFSCHGYPLW